MTLLSELRRSSNSWLQLCYVSFSGVNSKPCQTSSMDLFSIKFSAQISPKTPTFSPTCLEFHHKLLCCLYLAIISRYLTCCVTVILLSGEINPGPKPSSRECLLICQWNLNSILVQSYTKVSLLTAYNLIHNFDIICVSETF